MGEKFAQELSSGFKPTEIHPIPTELPKAVSPEKNDSEDKSHTKEDIPPPTRQKKKDINNLAKGQQTFALESSYILESPYISSEIKAALKKVLALPPEIGNIHVLKAFAEIQDSPMCLDCLLNACQQAQIDPHQVPIQEIPLVLFLTQQNINTYVEKTPSVKKKEDIVNTLHYSHNVLRRTVETFLYQTDRSKDKEEKREQRKSIFNKKEYQQEKQITEKIKEETKKMQELIKKGEQVIVTQSSIDVIHGVIHAVGYIPSKNPDTGVTGTPVSWTIPIGRTEALHMSLTEEDKEKLDSKVLEMIHQAQEVMVTVHGYGANRLAVQHSVEKVLAPNHENVFWNEKKKVVGVTYSVMGSEHTMKDPNAWEYVHTCDQVMEATRALPLIGKKHLFVGHSMGGQTVWRLMAKYAQELGKDAHAIAIAPVVENMKSGHLKFFYGILGNILVGINLLPRRVRNPIMSLGLKLGVTQFLFDRLMKDPNNPDLLDIRAAHLDEMEHDDAYLKAVTKQLVAVKSLNEDEELKQQLEQLAKERKISLVIAGKDYILNSEDMFAFAQEMNIPIHALTKDGHYAILGLEYIIETMLLDME